MNLQKKIAVGEVIVLDGATGTEIARLGGQMNSAAWCAIANKTHPDTVRLISFLARTCDRGRAP